jgi:hypothetical protein
VAKFGLAALLSLGLVGALAPTAFAQETNNDSTPSSEARPHPRLTDAQKACLQKQGDQKPAEGTRPTDAQRAAHQAAAKACGITLPAHPGGPGGPHNRPQLTDAQKTCLAEHGVKKPVKPANGERLARPTDAQRAAFRAAAKDCGIKVPDKPPAGSSDSSNSNSSTST